MAPRPEPGDIVVWPSILRGGKRWRIGHVALIESVARCMEWDWAAPSWELLDVIHVCGPNGRKPAAVRATGRIWAGKERWGGETNAKWRSRVLRVVATNLELKPDDLVVGANG